VFLNPGARCAPGGEIILGFSATVSLAVLPPLVRWIKTGAAVRCLFCRAVPSEILLEFPATVSLVARPLVRGENRRLQGAWSSQNWQRFWPASS
jgi:hypothetical protein